MIIKEIPKGKITLINEILLKYDPAGTTSPDTDEYLTEATDILLEIRKAIKDRKMFGSHQVSLESVICNIVYGELIKKFAIGRNAITYDISIHEKLVDKGSCVEAGKEIYELFKGAETT
jgi:hypothetical protein